MVRNAMGVATGAGVRRAGVQATITEEEPRPVASRATPSLTHIPALDGLRAVAVLAVIAFHADLGWAKGGFLGVDVFFVLSGFLITSLLRAEHRRRAAVSLGAFWARRARRLLPALGFLFIVLIGYAALRPEQPSLTSLRGDMLAGIGYVANWRFVLTGNGYFAASAPSPLRHLWSLAIEEQFYLVWPLVFLLVVRARRPALIALGLAAASAALMFATYQSGDPSRVYYGTDTHAHGLLLGAALAFVTIRPSRWLSTAGVVAAAGALAAMYLFDGGRGYVYRGGLLAFELLIVVVVAACAQPRSSALGSALSWRPLRAIGLVSYGLYLWHWPVFVLCDEQLVGQSGYRLLAIQLLVTTALTLFSYWAIERPFRRRLVWRRRSIALIPVAFGAIAASLLLVTSTLESPIAAAERAARQELPVFSPTSGALRVLLVGDSTALGLTPGLQASANRRGIVAATGAKFGCALDWEASVVHHVSWDPLHQGPECNWRNQWPELVAQYRPDIALVMFGPGDIGSHRVGDRVYKYDSDDWRRRMTGLAEEAAAILGRDGAKVVFLLSPAVLLSTRDRGVARLAAANVAPLNAVYRSVASRPGVSVFDIGPVVKRGGAEYRWDAAHYTKKGAEVVGAVIIDWIMSRQRRSDRAPSAPPPLH